MNPGFQAQLRPALNGLLQRKLEHRVEASSAADG